MNKERLFVLGEKTLEMIKISEILDRANLDFKFATFNNKELTSENKCRVDIINDNSKDSVVYVNCSEEVPSFEYAEFIGEKKDKSLMEQFLNMLYLNELFEAGIIKYNPGSQSKVLGRVIKAPILINDDPEWLIDYMDFCGVSPIPEDISKFL
jgi:hypothetical protein